MSQFGQKVVAVIDTTSAFGVTIRTLKANVDTLTGQMSTLLSDAPETLDTLNEIAAAISDDPAFFTTMASANTTLQANIDALTTAASNARTALQAALQSDIDLRATIDTPTFTGHVFSPEFRAPGSGHLKLRAPVGNDLNVYLADEETLQITRDPSTGNPKFTAKGGSGEFKFNQKVDLDGGLKIGGTDVTATAAEINAVDGRLDVLEADAVTQAYVDAQVTNLVDAAPGALDTLNELAAALGDDADFATTITNSIAAVQADVNQNETDADTAIALKANIASPTFTTKIESPEYHAVDSHLKFKCDTNDIIFYPSNTETLQITRHSGTGHPNFTANGGSGEFKFNQSVDLADGFKVGGVAVTSTAAELNILDGVTATATELNYVDGVTSAIQTQLDALQTADAELTELATMASASAAAIADLSEAEIQILDGATVTTAELNILDGVTATAAELNYVDGVTSNIQTQLNAIQADVDQNETDADTSLASLSTNINNEGAARLLADNANETHIDNMATLTGVAKDETHLSTFTGSTVADNQTVKAAIQALETAVETKQATDAELTELATMASATAAALADLTEAEVQVLDGATVTTAELNILDGVTSTAAELNILDGVTATAAELNYVDGVTSNVQTQLDAKAALAGATFTGAVVQTPAASVTPGSNGELMVEATNNTTLTFKLKGSDGTVRSGTITLS